MGTIVFGVQKSLKLAKFFVPVHAIELRLRNPAAHFVKLHIAPALLASLQLANKTIFHQRNNLCVGRRVTVEPCPLNQDHSGALIAQNHAVHPANGAVKISDLTPVIVLSNHLH